MRSMACVVAKGMDSPSTTCWEHVAQPQAARRASIMDDTSESLALGHIIKNPHMLRVFYCLFILFLVTTAVTLI